MQDKQNALEEKFVKIEDDNRKLTSLEKRLESIEAKLTTTTTTTDKSKNS